MALMMVLTLTQCKKQEDNNDNNTDVQKVKVTCVVPMNNGGKSEFDNLMTDGTIKWSAGAERIYITIPDETNPQIVELTAFTTLESNILNFEGEVAEGLIQAGEYDVYYLGNSKNLATPYISETIENEVITSISGSIANQSGSLDDLGYCHIAKATVTAETNGEEVVLSLNGTLKNQIAIAHLDLADITNLKGAAIVGTEYTLQYNNGEYEFSVTQDASANITITEGTATSYVVMFPNATANVDLKSDTDKKITFVGGVEANKIYYKHISDVEYAPLTWVNVHEYVDLGLPSGLKWAAYNIGATTPEEYGNYYAWGEIAPALNNDYSNNNCQAYMKKISQLQDLGIIDENKRLTPEHDAATANWGNYWRMPTKEEYQELLDNCTWTWTTQNGVNGYKVASKINSNSIFLPAAGYRNELSLLNEVISGRFWSSTADDNDFDCFAWFLYINNNNNSNEKEMLDGNRRFGYTIRPVRN